MAAQLARGNKRKGLAPLATLSRNLSYEHQAGRRKRLLALLRQAAVSGRSQETQRFYSVREVTTHFHVPHSTVGRIFNQLKKEGLLTSAWGAKTVLQPAVLNRHVEVRGLLAMLTPMEPYDYRAAAENAFRSVWTKVWHLGFAARVWLYDSHEAESEPFIDEIISEKPDGIVWLMPHPRVTLLGHRLLDCGIPVVKLTAAMTYAEMLREVIDGFF